MIKQNNSQNPIRRDSKPEVHAFDQVSLDGGKTTKSKMTQSEAETANFPFGRSPKAEVSIRSPKTFADQSHKSSPKGMPVEMSTGEIKYS